MPTGHRLAQRDRVRRHAGPPAATPVPEASRSDSIAARRGGRAIRVAVVVSTIGPSHGSESHIRVMDPSHISESRIRALMQISKARPSPRFRSSRMGPAPWPSSPFTRLCVCALYGVRGRPPWPALDDSLHAVRPRTCYTKYQVKCSARSAAREAHGDLGSQALDGVPGPQRPSRRPRHPLRHLRPEPRHHPQGAARPSRRRALGSGIRKYLDSDARLGCASDVRLGCTTRMCDSDVQLGCATRMRDSDMRLASWRVCKSASDRRRSRGVQQRPVRWPWERARASRRRHLLPLGPSGWAGGPPLKALFLFPLPYPPFL